MALPPSHWIVSSGHAAGPVELLPTSVVLLASAWLQDKAGSGGLYIVALVSGLTDADASVLSTMRLFKLETIAGGEAVIAEQLAEQRGSD